MTIAVVIWCNAMGCSQQQRLSGCTPEEAERQMLEWGWVQEKTESLRWAGGEPNVWYRYHFCPEHRGLAGEVSPREMQADARGNVPVIHIDRGEGD
jgi:hypothetical protein